MGDEQGRFGVDTSPDGPPLGQWVSFVRVSAVGVDGIAGPTTVWKRNNNIFGISQC